MRFWLGAVFLLVVSVLAYRVSPVRIAYSMDYSLPYKWWLEVESFRDPKAGDYVLIKPPVENEYTKGKLLVKKVVCSEGDHIRTEGLDFYCNGNYLGRARTADSKGRPVKPVELNQYIGRGYYFVMGEHERSYDSRYFGLVPRENVLKLEYPLSTFPDLDFIFARREK